MNRKIPLNISVAIWFVAWAPLLLLALPSRRLSRVFLVAIAGGVAWLARVVAGIRYNIHGRPATGAIIASKHMSILETAIFGAHIPNIFFIIKRELAWIPIYGWCFWRIGLLPVNRAKGATNMAKLAEDAKKRIDSGMTLGIFPEGTRKKPGEPVKMRRGLLFLAESLKLPIQPVGLDTGLYWPKRGAVRGGTANVWFEPVLPYNASLEEIAAAIQRHSV